MKFYEVGDYIPFKDRERLGASDISARKLFHHPRSEGLHFMAALTEEFREPLKGEWYLSGAIPTAYRAFHDLKSEYRIMELVIVETKTTITQRLRKLPITQRLRKPEVSDG